MLRVKRYSKASRTYDTVSLNNAVLAVKKRELTVSKAAREFCIPRKTIDDHVKKDLKSQPGPDRMLTNEEEECLVNYLIYSLKQGFPMTRAMVRSFVLSIIKEDPDRVTLFNLKKGPSDEWFRKFVIRHPNLSEKEAQVQDRARSRMSNEAVVMEFFENLSRTVKSLGLGDKPDQIFNCDETGWSGKEKSRQKVFGLKGEPAYQQSLFASGHITGHLCICANGTILPSFVIFEKALPHTAYKDQVPGNWLYGVSDSGYMDSDLFIQWFQQIFIPNCGIKRPVLLLLDNHESHISIEVIRLARHNNIEMLGFPAHTTHLLQPLDVSLNGPLKAQVYKTATNLGFINKHQIMNKAKFPAVLSASIDTFCSPAVVKNSFRKTGIYPCNPDAIDKRLLIPSHKKSISNSALHLSNLHSSAHPVPASSVVSLQVSSQSESRPSTSLDSTSLLPATECGSSSMNTSICTQCGTFLGGNPLVKEGLVPAHLSHIFLPVPAKPMTVTRKLVTESRVLTSDEFLKKLEDRQEEKRMKKELVDKRKEDREDRKRQKETHQQEKQLKKNKRKANDFDSADSQARPNKNRAKKNIILCKICRLRDPEDDGDGDVDWMQCDICDEWCHRECCDISGEQMENDDFVFRCLICLELGEE